MSALPLRVRAHPTTTIIAGEKRNASSRFLQIFSHALPAVFASNSLDDTVSSDFKGCHSPWVNALLPSRVGTMGNLLLRMPGRPYQLNTFCQLLLKYRPEDILSMICVLHRPSSLRRCRQGSPRATSLLCLPRQVISIPRALMPCSCIGSCISTPSLSLPLHPPYLPSCHPSPISIH